MRTARPVGGGFVWYPTGSCRPPLPGGAIAWLSSTSTSSWSLLEELLPLRFGRSAVSAPASSSGGEVPLLVGVSAVALDRVLGLFVGGFVASRDEIDFLCLLLVTSWTVESSASSPEASRDDGWSRSAADNCLLVWARFVVRFRFDDPSEEGDDMLYMVRYSMGCGVRVE